jgi:hypothetical protein
MKLAWIDLAIDSPWLLRLPHTGNLGTTPAAGNSPRRASAVKVD